jgi:hypothetical protein
MSERRRSKRNRTILSGKIIFNNRTSVLDCVVKNISSSGAKLVLPNTLRVPNEFELYIPKMRCSYDARLIRYDSEAIGVEFYRAYSKIQLETQLCESGT